MKTNELRKLNDEELQTEMVSTLKEQFNLQMQKSTGEFNKPHLIKIARRKIARIKTLMTERVGN